MRKETELVYRGEEAEAVDVKAEEYCSILNLQQTILELVAAGREKQYVLDRLCQMAEALLTDSLASIMLKNAETGLMNVVAAPSIPKEGWDALNGLIPGPGGGSCGNAVFHNQPQYVTDTKTDCRWNDIRQIAYDFNLCACWSMPIRDEHNQAVGSFALSSFEHRSPSGFHRRLLEIGSSIVSIILKRSEHESQLQEASHALEILAEAVENASDGIVVTDSDNAILQVNTTFKEVFGYSNDEVIGKSPSLFSSGKHGADFYREMWSTLLEHRHWSGEIYNKRKSGEVFPEWLSISAIADERGRIQNYLAVFSDLSELHEQQRQLERLAYFDPISGLPNRAKLHERFKQKDSLVCVLFNIDSFKEVNDYFGIFVGDSILKQIGEWYRSQNLDVFHIGGDEFVILFNADEPFEETMKHVEEILSEIENQIFIVGEQSFGIRMTVGISVGNEKYLSRADIALHRAKERKKTIAVYSEEDNVEALYQSNIALSSEIRHALTEGRIICYYQPIVNTRTGKTDEYETLVRMIDSQGRVVPPMEFLKIAQKTKLYPEITRRVVREACTLFSSRSEMFSVNLSSDDITDPHTRAEILSTISETGTAERIVFEILESEVIENYQEVSAFIIEVKKLGGRIAIDDFGTGYSNFANLLNLNVDFIKIDGSLIQGIADRRRHSLVIETIVDFARKINAKTVAEFVSDESIYEAIVVHEIDFAQGYYVGKPAPLE